MFVDLIFKNHKKNEIIIKLGLIIKLYIYIYTVSVIIYNL